ncbi:MAG TPA: hypothetical protein VH092_19320 [Urbifossiella sp.]|nr:hypothetical protein [Urbifossiella sp.]
MTVGALTAHGREVGLPRYAPFDDPMIFQGTHRYPDALGRVIRRCLGPDVMPVFVPPRGMGFQAMVGSDTGWWQARVWARFAHPDRASLPDRSSRPVRALRRHRAARIEAAPARRPFPTNGKMELEARPRGRVVYVRRTNAAGEVNLLGGGEPAREERGGEPGVAESAGPPRGGLGKRWS